MSKCDVDDFSRDRHNRLPTEVFAAIETLQNGGTKTELLKRRADAIRDLLDQLLSHLENKPIGTIYDDLAIRAFKDGVLPPKKNRGRPKPDTWSETTDRFRKKLLRFEYKQLRAQKPHRRPAECLELLAERHKTDIEWLNNVVRASRTSLASDDPESQADKDIVDMWRQWEAIAKSRNK